MMIFFVKVCLGLPGGASFLPSTRQISSRSFCSPGAQIGADFYIRARPVGAPIGSSGCCVPGSICNCTVGQHIIGVDRTGDSASRRARGRLSQNICACRKIRRPTRPTVWRGPPRCYDKRTRSSRAIAFDGPGPRPSRAVAGRGASASAGHQLCAKRG